MTTSDIDTLLTEIAAIRKLLHDKEQELQKLRELAKSENDAPKPKISSLAREDIERFSRQIIIPDVGVKGQLALRNSSILVVGAGGLGCPAAQYLVGAGVGHIGIVDYDDVDTSNLHRQLLHSEESVGVAKVTSAAFSLKRLNSNVKISEFQTQLDSSNALNIIPQFDVVIDATDNVATRYLLNDACVLSGRPLVSGSALRLEGQLTVYHFNNGPCYRCLFPKPPPPETVTNCGDGGVLGVVPGAIGILEALEAIKIVLQWPSVLTQKLLLFDAVSCAFRNIRLRGRNNDCEVCGDNPKIVKLIDYEQFCGAKATDKDSAVKLLTTEERIKAKDLHKSLVDNDSLFLMDVRNPEEFEMCALPRSINIPMKKLDDTGFMNSLLTDVKAAQEESQCSTFPLYVVCRRGNDSQKAVKKLQELVGDEFCVRDLEGGLHAWARTVDTNFPIY